jgi:hypothetical protein
MGKARIDGHLGDKIGTVNVVKRMNIKKPIKGSKICGAMQGY